MERIPVMQARKSEIEVISRAQFLRAMIAMSVVGFSKPVSAENNLIKLPYSLVPVKVDQSRVIRSAVGLRPYRPSGFVLKAETIGHKTLVHNYGHGGAGVSLSWGCATLAADL